MFKSENHTYFSPKNDNRSDIAVDRKVSRSKVQLGDVAYRRSNITKIFPHLAYLMFALQPVPEFIDLFSKLQRSNY